MTLLRCNRVDGFSLLLNDELRIFDYVNVMCDGWSLYSDNQQIIADSSFFRGIPSYSLVNSKITTNLNINKVSDYFYNEEYFWLGPIHDHFGHFLISTLSRLWALKHVPKPIKIVYVGVNINSLFDKEFIKIIFSEIGLKREDFIQIKSSAKFSKIRVAQRAFNENHSISLEYNKFLSNIMENITRDDKKQSYNEYIYISKHKSKKGVRFVINEDELCQYLLSNGIGCFTPEEMDFRSQLSFWKSHNRLCGFSSSAMHLASIFGNKEIISVNHNNMASSNHILCDHYNKTKCFHLFSDDLLQNKGSNDKFSQLIEIKDVKKYGNSIIDYMVKARDKIYVPQKTPLTQRTVSEISYINEPLGENISSFGVCSQSSTYDIDEGKNRSAEGLINGKLTGGYQCHTNLEYCPWWKIDFDELYSINEIRIYNRLDSEKIKKRSSLFKIYIEFNDRLEEIYNKIDGEIFFGGKDGNPYRWIPEKSPFTKKIMIKLQGNTYLHFDQIEIFGEIMR